MQRSRRPDIRMRLLAPPAFRRPSSPPFAHLSSITESPGHRVQIRRGACRPCQANFLPTASGASSRLPPSKVTPGIQVREIQPLERARSASNAGVSVYRRTQGRGAHRDEGSAMQLPCRDDIPKGRRRHGRTKSSNDGHAGRERRIEPRAEMNGMKISTRYTVEGRERANIATKTPKTPHAIYHSEYGWAPVARRTPAGRTR